MSGALVRTLRSRRTYIELVDKWSVIDIQRCGRVVVGYLVVTEDDDSSIDLIAPL